MLFSVIYSADVPAGVSIRDYAPPKVRRLWDMTENGPSEYSYLEGRWEKRSKHRKWVALLDRQQFDEFVSTLGLYADDVETMGSLGAPGFGFGWSPAISFTADHENASSRPTSRRSRKSRRRTAAMNVTGGGSARPYCRPLQHERGNHEQGS